MPNKKLTMKKSRSAKREAKHEAKREAKHEAKCETKHEAKREAARAFSFRFTFHVYICYFLFSFIFQIYVWSLYFSFAFQTFVSYLHVRFLFLVQIYDLNVWFLASAFSLLKPGGTLKRVLGECSCADLALVAILFVRFWGSRNSFRPLLWLESCGGMLGCGRWYWPLSNCIRTL